MERQKTYALAYADKIKSLNQSQLEKMWDSLDSMKDYLQTSVTRNQYLGLVSFLKKTELTDESFVQLEGQDQAGEIHDEFYPDEEALQQLIIDLFYEKV